MCFCAWSTYYIWSVKSVRPPLQEWPGPIPNQLRLQKSQQSLTSLHRTAPHKYNYNYELKRKNNKLQLHKCKYNIYIMCHQWITNTFLLCYCWYWVQPSRPHLAWKTENCFQSELQLPSSCHDDTVCSLGRKLLWKQVSTLASVFAPSWCNPQPTDVDSSWTYHWFIKFCW